MTDICYALGIIQQGSRILHSSIDTDPDVADCYLRINPDNWLVKVMYIEESNLTSPNRDVALLNLMTDLKGSYGGNENWVLNDEAIHNLAESYRQIIYFFIPLN